MNKIKRSGLDKKGEISLNDLIDLVKNNPDIATSGAIVTFTGIVRGVSKAGKAVDKLELEAYDEIAEQALAQICDELRNKPGIVDVLIHHLIGMFSVGDDIVYIVVAGSSRKEVFPILVEAVEKYKHEAAIWKKEYLKDGTSYWISET